MEINIRRLFKYYACPRGVCPITADVCLFPIYSDVLHSTEIGYSLKGVVGTIDPDDCVVEFMMGHITRESNQ